MADWPHLTGMAQRQLRAALSAALSERGIDAQRIELDPSGLPGRYRLYVVAAEFTKLDYSERLNLAEAALAEAWQRKDRLRLTATFPLAPDELLDLTKSRGRARAERSGHAKRLRARKRVGARSRA